MIPQPYSVRDLRSSCTDAYNATAISLVAAGLKHQQPLGKAFLAEELRFPFRAHALGSKCVPVIGRHLDLNWLDRVCPCLAAQ